MTEVALAGCCDYDRRASGVGEHQCNHDDGSCNNINNDRVDNNTNNTHDDYCK